jgi:hypothetical protein
MLHEIGRELGAVLAANGCPFVVVDGPEQVTAATWGRRRIVIEHDAGGDSFSAPRNATRNPRIYQVRNIGVKLTIYAQSTATGARPFEHRRLAEQVLDQVVVALTDIAAVRRNAVKFTGGKFIQPADLDKSEFPPGVAYELTFTFDRGITGVTWAGAAEPETTITPGRVKSITKVSRVGTPDNDNNPNTPPPTAEIACGA